mgnify:FL=1
MESAVRKELAEKVKAHLSSEGVKKSRATLQKVRPQILFLDNLNFINDTIKELTERKHIKNVSLVQISADDLTKARQIAKTYQDTYIAENLLYPDGGKDIEQTPAGKHLKKNSPHLYKKILANEAFVVRSFSVMAEIKTKIIKEFVNATEAQLKKIISRVDRGHGAGDGVAVSGVAAARAFGEVDTALGDDKESLKQFNDEFSKFLQNAFDEGDIDAPVVDAIKKVTIQYDSIVTPDGEIKQEYIPIVEFQDKYTNRVTDKARETTAKKLIEKFFKKVDAGEIVALEGSSPLRDKVFSVAISKVIDIKVQKGQTIKVTIDKNIDPKKVKLKNKGKADTKSRDKDRKGKTTVTKGRPTAVPKGRQTPATRNSLNIKSLLGIMNSRINDTVAKNMGPPRLENRTGTFAGSVRITDVSQTRQGFPSIGYTYQRNPYGVFETTSGSRFADPKRDPRPLIDASIREIAAQFAIGRLYTRRI